MSKSGVEVNAHYVSAKEGKKGENRSHKHFENGKAATCNKIQLFKCNILYLGIHNTALHSIKLGIKTNT